MRFCRSTALALLILVVAAAGVSAHHSASQFANEEAAARGTVVQVNWRNPHVTIDWDVKDANNKVVRWTGELASVSTVMAEGMTRNSLKPGDDVIFVYRPAKAGTPESIIGAILRPNGGIVLAFSRQAGGSEQERAQRHQARLKLLAPFGLKVEAQ